MTIHAYTDGASRGNPGESGIGIVFKDELGKTLYAGGGYIGPATNNIAEYQALIACLKKAKKIKCTKLVVHSDSELIVRQLQGTYKVRSITLGEYVQEVRQILRTAPYDFVITHIDRETNRDADKLANIGIDSKRKLRM